MPYREKRILSGEIMEVEVYPITLHEYKKPRSKKIKESRKEQKHLNAKNSIKTFKRKMYANFDDKSYFATLSYKSNLKPRSEKEAMKDLQNFLRRMKYKLKKESRGDLKYIAVIESGEDGKNYHIHIVIDANLTPVDIEKLWSRGVTTISRLDPSKDGIEGLARYVSKEPKGSKRWLQSKNLIMPKVEVNDSRYRSRKSIDGLSRSVFDREEIEKLYPGFEYITGQAELNLLYGGTYITLMMRRRC